MSNRWPVRVRFGGLGGQGLVTLGAVLAEAGALCGLQVAASQSYGSRARGGATLADVILSAEEIDFPHVIHPDILVVLAQEAHELYAPAVAEGGVILYDDFFVKPAADPRVRLFAVSGTSAAVEKLGNKVAANFVMFGALVGYTQVITPEAAGTAMKNQVSPRFLAVNQNAFGLGIALGAELMRAEGRPWR
jgi:2-oxoglutarate ferredoxin oxidoreductase subunit gamma